MLRSKFHIQNSMSSNTCAVCCVSGVPQVSRDDREGWWVQPHGVQEPELQGRLLLGLSGALGATWVILVGRSVCLVFYTHACTFTHTHACTFTHTHMHAHVQTFIRTRTHTHTHTHLYTHTHFISTYFGHIFTGTQNTQYYQRIFCGWKGVR